MLIKSVGPTGSTRIQDNAGVSLHQLERVYLVWITEIAQHLTQILLHNVNVAFLVKD